MAMQLEGPIAIDTSICLHVDDIVAGSFSLFGGDLVSAKPLRLYPDGSFRSGYLILPAGWICDSRELQTATVQLLLRSGRMSADGVAMLNPGFICVPSGKRAPVLVAQEACELIVIIDRPSAPVDSASVLIPNVLAVEPFTPSIPGWNMQGFERRVLWLDPMSGADTRLLRVPAGFRGGGPNWHPVQEEIFCLEGDIEPDETRPMRAGSFLWNQAGSIHGFSEHTKDGCTLLEWHDGPWDLIKAPGIERPANLG